MLISRSEQDNMPVLSLNNTGDQSGQTRGSRSQYTNWGAGTSSSNSIWATPAAPIGTGKKESARSSSRPAPLAPFTNDVFQSTEELPTPNQVTGSGSLLTSSEGEGWSHRSAWQLGSGSSGLSSGRGRPGTHQSSTSPVRNRTTQHTRESSPFFTPQPSAIGTAPILTKPASTSHLDPTTTSFAPRNNAGPFGSSSALRSEWEDTSRRQTNGYGNTSINGVPSYSGYASSTASRNGSLPPSRHGMDAPVQFGDFGLNNGTYAEPIAQRSRQQARNPNFSANGYSNGRISNHAWQSSLGDLSFNMARQDLNRNVQDRPGSSNWESASQNGYSGGFNGVSASIARSGSLSLEAGTNLLNPSLTGYGQNRYGYGQDPSSYSPTESESRQGAESPIYLSNPTPPPQEWHRGLPSHNSRTNLNGYGGLDRLQLDRALNQVADAQSYQPSPALSHRSLYSATGYNITGASTPNYRMGHQISPYYTQQQSSGMPYGQSIQSARHPPRGPAMDNTEKKGSLLLQEFHLSKGSRKYEIKDIYGHIVEFSGDQHGSRFLQAKLEGANSDEKSQIFAEIVPNAIPLMTDLFGNYVIQKFFEHGNQQQKKQLAEKMRGNMPFLSQQMYGCRVVQKAFDVILVDQQASLIKELDGKVIKCVKDQNGNHVIQKAIERVPSEHITFITGAFTNQVHSLAVHNYGCRVIQRMLESSHEPAKTNILEELHGCVESLVVDQFGNYVTQNIVKHGRPSDRDKVIAIVTSNLVSFATQKYASNVVETAFVHGTYEQRQKMIGVVTSVDKNGESTTVKLMRDQFGNYIIQRFIKHLQEVASDEEYENFVEMLKPQLEKLKNISYGKQVGQVEKLLMPGGRTQQISQPSSIVKTDVLAPLDTSSAPTPPLINEDTQSPHSSSQPSTSHSTADDGDAEPSAETSQKTADIKIAVANHQIPIQVTASEP